MHYTFTGGDDLAVSGLEVIDLSPCLGQRHLKGIFFGIPFFAESYITKSLPSYVGMLTVTLLLAAS